MLRTLWVAVVLVMVTIPCALLTIILTAFPAERLVNSVIRFWARSLVWAAGVELRAENLDVLDPAQRYIIIANHYSYFDIPCIFTAIPQPIRFMAKASLFKIPLFGWCGGSGALARTPIWRTKLPKLAAVSSSPGPRST